MDWMRSDHVICVFCGSMPRSYLEDNHATRHSPPQVCQRRRSETAASDTPGGSGRSSHNGTEGSCALTPTRTARSRSVSWDSKCKQFASKQYYVENSNCSTAVYDRIQSAVSEEEKIVAITKIVLNLMKQNGH
jgi:hypothetical protein